MVTTRGLVKKTPLKEYDSHRKDGILGISLNEGDSLLGVRLIEEGDEIMLQHKTGLFHPLYRKRSPQGKSCQQGAFAASV